MSSSRVENLLRLLRTMSDVEQERFSQGTGLDIYLRPTDEAMFSMLEKNIADFRGRLSKEVQRAELAAPIPERRCDCCGVAGEASPYYITVPRCRTFCAECANALLVEGRKAGR